MTKEQLVEVVDAQIRRLETCAGAIGETTDQVKLQALVQISRSIGDLIVLAERLGTK